MSTVSNAPDLSRGTDPHRVQAITVFVCVLGALLYYIWQIHFGFNPRSISDEHGFRQTQTAVTVQEFEREHGVSLNYGTPFLGRPWSVPFEFPFFQALVYFLSSSSGLDIITAGRLLSVSAYLLCLWLLFLIARQIGAPEGGPLTAVFGLIIPFYLFWSRAFLIESTALALTLAALLFALRTLERAPWFEIFGLFVCSMIAAATKITTFFPVAVGTALLCSVTIIRELRRSGWVGGCRRLLSSLHLWCIALALVCGLGCAYLWTSFADDIKAAHPLAGYLTSGALKPWIYGSWEQRWEGWRWEHLLNHYLFGLGSHSYFSLALLVSALILGLIFSKSRYWVLFFVFLFLLPIGTFFNLYVVHNYYSNANLLFLLMAVGIALSGWGGRATWCWVPKVLSVLIIGSLVTGMADAHYSRLMVNEIPAVPCLRHLRRVTPKNALIVGFGWGISPEIAFYSNRRAMLFNGFPLEQWDRALDLQDPRMSKVVVVEPTAHADEIQMALHTAEKLGLRERQIEGCNYRFFSTLRGHQ
ncbi:MAG: glycosyltransferase family 39 protein [Oligoflexia bacterium]|nr:glycosyltransferase family 39 protein [Oligoflexia bacterium]